MPISERLGQWARSLQLGWYLLLAVVVALAWIAYRRWLDSRSQAAARRSHTLRASQATGEAIEQAESDRIRLLGEAKTQALMAKRARDRAERIASRVERGGHPNLADLIRSWNSE